ncbi:hypothetical protein DPMN_059841 [Dreissena polymorpha]|uniref:Uncharacterized protein n=1 Tax=Dreissena polymorpha TaxID=45954 RepID=A0A9D4C4N9_DREPO|nr:hypothetical protein DPMN_059841 [Dreissena polymorpha]
MLFENENAYFYNARALNTLSLLSNESQAYLFLLFSLFQRPCRFQQRSLTPAFAAHVAPPARNECKPIFALTTTSLYLAVIHSRLRV